jgi:hypothetical protein
MKKQILLIFSVDNKKNRRNRRKDNQPTVYCHFPDAIFEKNTFILSKSSNNNLLIMYLCNTKLLLFISSK